jgi:hypothetical protein
VETLTYPKISCMTFNSHSCILDTISAPLRKQSDVLGGISDFIKRRVSGAGAINPILPSGDLSTAPDSGPALSNPAPLTIEDVSPPEGQPTPVPQ